MVYLNSMVHVMILGTLNKPSPGVSKITTDRLRQFPEVSNIICWVLFSLLFILKSPNIAFNNFTVSIASPVTAREQESRNRKQRLKHSQNYNHPSHVIITKTTKPHAACVHNLSARTDKKNRARPKSPEKALLLLFQLLVTLIMIAIWHMLEDHRSKCYMLHVQL